MKTKKIIIKLCQDEEDYIYRFAQSMAEICDIEHFQSSRANKEFQKVLAESERLRTPWFLGQMILENSILYNAIIKIMNHSCLKCRIQFHKQEELLVHLDEHFQKGNYIENPIRLKRIMNNVKRKLFKKEQIK